MSTLSWRVLSLSDMCTTLYEDAKSNRSDRRTSKISNCQYSRWCKSVIFTFVFSKNTVLQEE